MFPAPTIPIFIDISYLFAVRVRISVVVLPSEYARGRNDA
jgi:hypothetical protein